MSHLDYNLGQIPFQDEKWSTGVAYICIPADIDRDIFISDCFSRSTVMIKTQDGGVYRNCPINVSTFNDIVWPIKYTLNGTPVVYITEPIHQQPIVIGALSFSDEIVDQNEQQFKMKRVFNNSIVEISGSAKEGFLTILVDGQQNSNFNIRLANKNNKATLNVDIDGQITINTTQDITIQSQTKIVQKAGIEDECTTTTQDANEINHRLNKFTINDGQQAILLGNKVKKYLDDLTDEIGRTTVTTSLGQMPILNAQQIIAFKNKTQELLSEISFTD